jgi:hypothetical protein
MVEHNVANEPLEKVPKTGKAKTLEPGFNSPFAHDSFLFETFLCSIRLILL